MLRPFHEMQSARKSFVPNEQERYFAILARHEDEERVSRGEKPLYEGMGDKDIIWNTSFQGMLGIMNTIERQVVQALGDDFECREFSGIKSFTSAKAALPPLPVDTRELEENPINTLFTACLASPAFQNARSFLQLRRFHAKLARVISFLRDEYQKLDEEKPRNDGSSHMSHALETTMILVNEVGNFDEVMVFTCLMHDFLEDTDHLGQEDKMSTMRLVLQDTIRPERGYDRSVIPLVQSLTKKPLEAYITDQDTQIWDSIPHADMSIDQAVAEFEKQSFMLDPTQAPQFSAFVGTLKKRRQQEYYGKMADVEGVPSSINNREKFIFRKMTVKFADRIHGLRNMDMSEEQMSLTEQIQMIEKKIRETRTYFLPAVEVLIQEYDGKPQFFGHWEYIKSLIEGAIVMAEAVLRQKLEQLGVS